MIICKRPAPLGDNLQPRKGREKCIFETLHNEINVFWVSKNQILMEKMGHNFHICLRLGLRGLPHRPPPYGQPDRKYPFFYAFPIND